MAVLNTEMLFRPDLNNVSLEFAAVPSFFCGQMSWSLFGLGRRMFEENLYDAIPSIIELFLYNLQSFGSLAVEGSVFLLVKKAQEMLASVTVLSKMECLGFQLGYLIRLVSGFILFFSYCSSWLFPLCGRSVAGMVWRCTMSLWTSRQCSLWMFPVESSRPGGVGGPWCPSGAPLMSQCLSMGLRGHVHKAVQSHLFMARDSSF